MKVVEDVRRERLLQLKDEHKSWVALNKLLGMEPRDSTLSQIANAATGSKTLKPKAMGSPLARRLEAVCKKPAGWMDTDPAFDGAGMWPFDLIPHERIAELTSSQRGFVQSAIADALDRLDALGKRSGTHG